MSDIETNTKYTLSFEPTALERCFLVADVLEELWGEPLLEYGLLGVVDQKDLFHVVATPLLTGQEVTGSSVFQSGHDLLRLRSEIQILSRKMNRRLLPMCWIHRHPGSCEPSDVDRKFVSSVFINQVAAAITLPVEDQIISASATAARTRVFPQNLPGNAVPPGSQASRREYALCFALIVNQKREHTITAVTKEFHADGCASPVRYVPAEVGRASYKALSPEERTALRRQLNVEIEAKIRLASVPLRDRRI